MDKKSQMHEWLSVSQLRLLLQLLWSPLGMVPDQTGCRTGALKVDWCKPLHAPSPKSVHSHLFGVCTHEAILQTKSEVVVRFTRRLDAETTLHSHLQAGVWRLQPVRPPWLAMGSQTSMSSEMLSQPRHDPSAETAAFWR